MTDNKGKTKETQYDEEGQKVPFGDDELEAEAVREEVMDATWDEVFQSCCVHTPAEWGFIGVGVLIALFFLYFFLFGLDLLGASAKVMGGCRAGSLFGSDTNPLAGIMIGILSTVLLQSSSTTTSIVVSLVPAIVSIDAGIFMIMGANIGTSVTNSIVCIGQIGNADNLERAFAGATVHDMFNFLSVGVLLPVEAATGYLHHLTGAMVKNIETNDGESWEGPLKKIVDPLTNKIIKENKSVIKGVAAGGVCEDFYPIDCEGGVVSADTCDVGLISCDSDTNECPVFFDQDANLHDDKVAGGVAFFIAICILFICLAGLITVLQKLVGGVSSRIIYKATGINGYLAMVVGCGITIFVQSSSITTSVLTPLVGAGALRLEDMYPLTLGANLGTTLSAIMAAMVSDSTDSLQVALAHLFFNITGIIIWYPVPFMRNVPLRCSRQLGRATRLWRGFPIPYVIVLFFIVPLALLGLSALFTQDSKGLTALGTFLVILIFFGICGFIYWWRLHDGKNKIIAGFESRQRRRETMKDLPTDMKYLMDNMETLKTKVSALTDHTGLPDEERLDAVVDTSAFYEDDDKEKTANSDGSADEVET